VGLLITIAILRIVWDSGKAVFPRLLDGVNPEVIHEIRQALKDVQEVHNVTDVRVRWLGHRLHAEVNLAVNPGLSIAEAHAIALEARHRLLHRLSYLSNVTIHVDPDDLAGEEHHRVIEHAHENLSNHSHP
jgi:divalent metal cation (Fe/Co/Zn/Cd) transporter